MSTKHQKTIRFYGFIGINLLAILLITGCVGGKQIVVQPDGSRILIAKEAYVVGESEPVMIKKVGVTLPARIDTGAKTSSLGAKDIELFERDGKRWIRFAVMGSENENEIEIEAKLVKTIRIKMHGAESVERPVVKLRAQLGNVEQLVDFSLADRSVFEYPVLIGRNFLSGLFVVDVSKKNITSPLNEKVEDDK